MFLVCFDIANRESFKSVERKWIPETSDNYVLKRTPFIIVGCKDDLREGFNLEEDCPERDILIYGYSKASCNPTMPSDVMDVIGIYLGNKIDFDAQRLVNKYRHCHQYMVCSALEMRGLKEIIREVGSCCLVPKKIKKDELYRIINLEVRISTICIRNLLNALRLCQCFINNNCQSIIDPYFCIFKLIVQVRNSVKKF